MTKRTMLVEETWRDFPAPNWGFRFSGHSG